MPMMGLNLDRWLSRRQPYHCTITTYTYSEFIIRYLYVMIVYYSSLDNAILMPLAITLMMSYPLLL